MRVAQIFNDLKNSILDAQVRNEQMAGAGCFFGRELFKVES